MSYAYDRGEVNELYRSERDEYVSAVRSMTEAERALACGHSNRVGRVCPDCADTIDVDEC
jgi:hypothetical protein